MTNQERQLNLVKSATFGKDVFFLKGKKITLGKIFELPDCLEVTELTVKDNLCVIVLWGKKVGWFDEDKKEEEKT